MTIYSTACAAVFALMVAGSTALAQTPAAQPNTAGCTPQEKSAQNPSEKFAQSNGVVCPPDIVDPGVKKPPAAGNTPVIPPPK
jgi:hypothetical protein